MEPSTAFEYPSDEQELPESALQLRMQGFNACFFCLTRARTIRARHIMIEAADYVLSRSNENQAKIARRLGIARFMSEASPAVASLPRMTRPGKQNLRGVT